MKCALIMAGGKGTRFWPVSTEDRPKQFLNLLGNSTMLQMTVDRILPIIPIERIFICTGYKYINLVKEQIPNLPERNIIIEPEGRNTAPCISLSAMIINKYYPDCSMLVLPADHLVAKQEEFIDAIEKANKFVIDKSETLITFGIRPNRPETGYGYIKVENGNNEDIKKVKKFVEKPDYDKALEYLLSGNFLWNSGIFLWNTKYIIELIREFLPNTYEALSNIVECDDQDLQSLIDENYKMTDCISIDYGIMEKADSIYVVPCDFGWDDVGSWNSLERYAEKDGFGNVFMGSGITYNSSNNIILSKKPILVNGIEDIIIVETEDYIMISSKSKEQEIKEAKAELDKLESREE